MEIAAAALGGMNRAETRLENTAKRLAAASDPTDSVDISSDMVSLIEARNDFAVNANVERIAGQMQKNILNMLL